MGTENKTERYVSKYSQLRIVLKPSYTSELNGRVLSHKGEDVQFEGGFYETDNASIIEQLEQRPEFGSIFIKVPSDTKDAVEHRNDMLKDLEDRQKDIEAREKALAEKEAKLSNQETGKVDELEDLKRTALNEIAEGLGIDKDVYRPGQSNDKVIKAIKEAQSVPGEGSEGAY